jgi:membrane fusion protein (multidrug efflux system)
VRAAAANATDKRNAMKVPASVLMLFIASTLSACTRPTEAVRRKAPEVTVTTPQAKTVAIAERYVCKIQSQHHVSIRAVERGRLEAILVSPGQAVQENDVLFKIQSRLHQAKRDAEAAETQLAQVQLDHARQQHEDKLIPQEEVAVAEARLARAQAHLAAAELNFDAVTAPFAGIVGGLHHQRGSLVERGEILTTLSDNSLMRVYFKIPEARYLDHMADRNSQPEDLKIELELASGSKFPQTGRMETIDGHFNHETGTITFRADFPNPDGLLRHGQTGTVLLSRMQKDALVIPQRATFEMLDKRYVYVVDAQDVAHQREVVIENELDDLFVVSKGIGPDDKIVLEGIRYVRDGDKVEYKMEQPRVVPD